MSTRISEQQDVGSRRGAKPRRRSSRAAPTVPSLLPLGREIGGRAAGVPSPRLCTSARALFFLTPLLLAACGSATDRGDGSAADSGYVDCAPQNAAEFKRICTLDRVAGADGLTLVVHNPDGGFHRLRVTTDGRGVVAADGAEQARVTIVGPGTIEVAVGGDRYHLPATIKGQAPS